MGQSSAELVTFVSELIISRTPPGLVQLAGVVRVSGGVPLGVSQPQCTTESPGHG